MHKAAFVVLLCVFWAQTAAADRQSVFGLWRDPESQAEVEIYPCSDGPKTICGRITNLPQGMLARDERNRDPSLRKRLLLGLEILQDFHKVNDTLWEGGGDFGRKPGRIYLPSNGEILGDHKNAYAIILVDSDRLEIRASNCFFSCMFKKTWVRVER